MEIIKLDALWPKRAKMSRKGSGSIIDLDNFLILQFNLNRCGNSPEGRFSTGIVGIQIPRINFRGGEN
jgi:hypothetical protein